MSERQLGVSAREASIGRLWIVAAAVLWSTSGLFAKSPWFDGWPEDSRGLLLAFFRSLFAMLVLLPLVRRPCWRWPMLPMTLSFATMVWSFMSAMVHGPAANAIWLQYLCPAWVVIGGVAWLRERVTAADRRMLVSCLAGVLLILAMELRAGGTAYATALGLLSGVAFAGVVLSMRAMADVDPAWTVILNHSATVVLLAPWAWQLHEPIEATGYVALGLFGIVQMSVPYLMFARGLRSTSSPEASVLALIEPILVPLWVYLAWHQHPGYQPPPWWTWAGGGLILFGLLRRYLPMLAAKRPGGKRGGVKPP